MKVVWSFTLAAWGSLESALLLPTRTVPSRKGCGTLTKRCVVMLGPIASKVYVSLAG